MTFLTFPRNPTVERLKIHKRRLFPLKPLVYLKREFDIEKKKQNKISVFENIIMQLTSESYHKVCV